jgi:hypothetical protein
MGWTKSTLLVAATAAAGVAAVKVMSARGRGTTDDRRRHAITVYRPIDEIRTNGKLPSPLADLGDRVEIDMRPAPGDRGTEILVRARDGGSVSVGEIRRALRDVRSLVETGDVLLPSGPATTTPTLLNKPLRAVTRRGREGGSL